MFLSSHKAETARCCPARNASSSNDRRRTQQQGDELGAQLSIKTIESHRASAMRKLNVTSTAGLVRYAIETSLSNHRGGPDTSERVAHRPLFMVAPRTPLNISCSE